MKKILFFLAAALVAAACGSTQKLEPANPDYYHTPKNVKYVFTEASDLTMYGKIFNSIPNPYHRVDTVLYKGFTATENLQVRESSGIACCFKTNSSTISVLTDYATPTYPANTNGFSARGYDLYIKDANGNWLWAASGVQSDKNLAKNLILIKDMEQVEHECILYFPLYSEEYSIQIGVEEDAVIEAVGNPFRHRLAVFGSSFTHGSSTSRSGMAYPAQFSRATGMQMLSLGCSGNCKLQDYFCTVLCDVDADAFIFDAFSNPGAEMIRERLMPFIDRMIAAHPGKPLIFQQTIYREGRNFVTQADEKEQAKMDMALTIFKEMKSTREGREKYKDVYLIFPDAVSPSHEATVDGTHPDNYGYTLWAESIKKPVLKILRKYGLR